MGGRLHLFDVDHTLARGSSGRLFAEAAARRGLIKLRHLALVPLNYAAYRLGDGGVSFLERDFPIIKGVERAVLEELGREVFERKLKGRLRPELLGLIASIQAEGGSIVLATSSLDFIVRPLADYLGADALLASSLEFEDGRCTGRLAGEALFGVAKRDAALAYARARGISPADCAFYSDSIHDLPLLLAVGSPVAVKPDHRLKKESKSRGWALMLT
jgi:HAD superfamily hydrolase (TIGR01490 family)